MFKKLLYLKYVDDATVASMSCNSNDCSLQVAADYLISWSTASGMIINAGKTKEMLIYFGRKTDKALVKRTEFNGNVIETKNEVSPFPSFW